MRVAMSTSRFGTDMEAQCFKGDGVATQVVRRRIADKEARYLSATPTCDLHVNDAKKQWPGASAVEPWADYEHFLVRWGSHPRVSPIVPAWAKAVLDGDT
jgi:hypothetical protein